MEIGEHKQKLIDKFISEELAGEELVEFQQLMHSHEAFANIVMEQTYTAAALEAIREGRRINKTKHDSGKVKQLWVRATAIAAVILLIFVMGIQIGELKNKPNQVVAKIDTIYYRQADIINIPENVAKVRYSANLKMDRLVALSAYESRSSTQICLPVNNASFTKNEDITFSLNQFKPNAYRFTILGFISDIEAVDTLCCKKVSVTNENKIICKWKPQALGKYYWMVHRMNDSDPYLVRSFIVK